MKNFRDKLIKEIIKDIDQRMMMVSEEEFEGFGFDEDEYEEAVKEIEWTAQALKNIIKNFEPIAPPEDFTEYEVEKDFKDYRDY